MTRPSAESGRIRVLLVGDVGVDQVADAVGGHDDVELVGCRDTVGAAAELLATVDVDAVLLGTAARVFPAAELAALREHTRAPVILLAPAEAAEVLEVALRTDVADALLLPQPAAAIAFALRRAVGAVRGAPTVTAGHGRIATVFSPKGGTGKSATATNLAVAFARCAGRRTLLLDLDLQFGDCAVMLGLDPELTVHDLVASSGELDADKLSGYVTRHASGLDLLAAPRRPEEAELVSVTRLVRLLDVAREAYDTVVVDTAPFLHGPILTALDHTDVLLLLATLDVPTLKDVRQSLETLELISFPEERISLVLNKADAAVGMTRADVEAAFGRRFAFALPEDRRVPLAVNRSTPVLLADPRSDYARAVAALAETLLATVTPRAVEVAR